MDALLDLLHPADVGEPHAGRGRTIDADLGQWLVAGPLVEQFVGRVGHDVRGRHRGGRRRRGRRCGTWLQGGGRRGHHGQRGGVVGGVDQHA